ncbi:MAG: hypothetical protein M3M94_02660 [Actinomycetota bacterium]|nr:hypothetical protein [Actinomycetota bacterium]
MTRATTELEWIRLILGGGRSPGAEASGARSEPSVPEESFAVFPSAANPRLLLPLTSTKAAASALRTRGYGVRAPARIGRAAARIGVRTGVAQRVLRTRVSLSHERPAPLVAHLRDVLGRADLEIAIRLGRLRPNRKPVVQILTRDGETLAFAKLGWNGVTRELVANETRVLLGLSEQARAPRAFVAPRVVHGGRWRDLEVLVLSPLAGVPFTPRRARRDPPVEATREIAALEHLRSARLADSDYWRSRRSRIEHTERSGLGEIAERLEARYGGATIPFGAWHGDWTPWNIASRGRVVSVWDWERSGELVPVGLDAAHYDLHLALAARNLESASIRGGPMLKALRTAFDVQSLLVALDLLEMSLRREEGRQAGMELAESPHRRALERLVGL